MATRVFNDGLRAAGLDVLDDGREWIMTPTTVWEQMADYGSRTLFMNVPGVHTHMVSH